MVTSLTEEIKAHSKKLKYSFCRVCLHPFFRQVTINICRFNPLRTFFVESGLSWGTRVKELNFKLEFENFDQGPWFAYDPFMAP